ncbi:hypothetical protein BC826DRAFT_444466 [Russula brevipes]|nr:hypothetical protein BC826DRAFT_444466 [Russula brevipes]
MPPNHYSDHTAVSFHTYPYLPEARCSSVCFRIFGAAEDGQALAVRRDPTKWSWSRHARSCTRKRATNVQLYQRYSLPPIHSLVSPFRRGYSHISRHWVGTIVYAHAYPCPFRYPTRNTSTILASSLSSSAHSSARVPGIVRRRTMSNHYGLSCRRQIRSIRR